jgi:hypothetical protein
VVLRAADGGDDLLLAEAHGAPLETALALASRRAVFADGTALDAASLSVTDFEVLLLELRRGTLGPIIECVVDCAAHQCGERLEMPLRVDDFLADVHVRQAPGVISDAGRPGWFSLDGVAFRLPTAGDQAALFGRIDAAERLVERCFDGVKVPAPKRARIERCMERLAPEVSRPLEGRCPMCGEAVGAFFHVPSFVVRDLARASAGVHEDVYWIASTYHWSEASILALPRRRRRLYAERARQHLLGVA